MDGVAGGGDRPPPPQPQRAVNCSQCHLIRCGRYSRVGAGAARPACLVRRRRRAGGAGGIGRRAAADDRGQWCERRGEILHVPGTHCAVLNTPPLLPGLRNVMGQVKGSLPISPEWCPSECSSTSQTTSRGCSPRGAHTLTAACTSPCAGRTSFSACKLAAFIHAARVFVLCGRCRR